MKRHRKLLLITFALASFVIAYPRAAATLLVSPTGVSTGNCQVTACTWTRAMAVAVSGDTVDLGTGTTYSADLDVSVAGLTITGGSAAIAAAVYTCDSAHVVAQQTAFSVANPTDCGVPSGSNTLPQINGEFDVSSSNTTVQYIKVRRQASRNDNFVYGIDITAENVLLDHVETYNGGLGVDIGVKRNVTLRHMYIHAGGTRGTETDVHGVNICTFGTISTSFSTQILIESSTIRDMGGDAIQENTAAYCDTSSSTSKFAYLSVGYSDMSDTDEQCGDFKGSSFVKWYSNDCHDVPYTGLNTTDDPLVPNKTDYDVWNSRFADIPNYAMGWSQNQDCSKWRMWNNIFIRLVTSPDFNYSGIQLCGDSGSHIAHNLFYLNSDTPNQTGKHTAAIKDNGSGANIQNNIFYSNGTGSDDHGHMSAIGGEDVGTPNFNYVNNPSTASCGAACKVGNNTTTTCYAVNNCPGWTNPGVAGGDDYSLVSTSPARAHGGNLNSTTTLTATGNYTINIDALGRTRSSTSPDLGPFNFGSSSPVSGPIPNRLRSIFH